MALYHGWTTPTLIKIASSVTGAKNMHLTISTLTISSLHATLIASWMWNLTLRRSHDNGHHTLDIRMVMVRCSIDILIPCYNEQRHRLQTRRSASRRANI